MGIIFKHQWLLYIIMMFVYAFIIRKRAKLYINLNPSSGKDFDKLFKYLLIIGNIPWLIIGFGDIFGLTNEETNFLNPSQLNPIVLTFHTYFIGIGIFGSYWIYIKDGADYLAKHSLILFTGLQTNTVGFSPKKVKFIWTIIVVGGIIGEIMSWISREKEVENKPSNSIVHNFQYPHLVYDFADCLPRFDIILLLLGFISIGIVMYYYNKIYVDKKLTTSLGFNKRKSGMVFGIIFASFAGLISILSIQSIFVEYFKTKSLYDKKQYQIIEGIVENYHPMPAGGHDTERFTINNVKFEFSDFNKTDYGYNNAASLGGAIKEGLCVRIGYFFNGEKNVIIKLETE